VREGSDKKKKKKPDAFREANRHIIIKHAKKKDINE
jgi:hypothetical protein